MWADGQSVRNKCRGLIRIFKKIRVGCFSENGWNILMWGHYCRKFTGFVVKFRVSYDDWGNDLHKVNYVNERVYLSSFDDNALGTTQNELQLLTQKSKIWDYENEWRYIKLSKDCEKDDDGYFKKIDKNAVLEIILGCRMDRILLDEVIKICRSQFGYSFPIKVAYPSRNYFSLEAYDYDEIKFALPWR